MKWHVRYLGLAKEIASWSKDPSSQIGAVAVGDNGQLLAQGYNGFPRGIDDKPERLNDRTTKYNYVVHGEMNCIYNAGLNGVSLQGSVLFVHGLPVCHECCKGILQVGVESIVMGHPPGIDSVWEERFALTKEMLLEAKKDFVRYEYFFNTPMHNSMKLLDGIIHQYKGGLPTDMIGHNGQWERRDSLDYNNISY